MTPYLIPLLFQATVLLLAAAIASGFLYKAAASLRYRVWTYTLFGLLILPILSPLLPTLWNAGVPLRSEGVPLWSAGVSPAPGFTGVSPEVIGNTATTGDTVAGSYVVPTQTQVEVVPVVTPTLQIRCDYILCTIWLFGTTVLLVHLLLSIHGVRRMLSFLESVTDPVFDALRREFGIRCPIRLVLCQSGTVPFISGIFCPIIVLPPQSQGWTEAEKRAVLTHELAHVVRCDLLWQMVTQIVCAVYWFHPLVWFAAYKIWVERESACDDTVVLCGEKPSVYADLLLELANGFKGQKPGLLRCTVAITRKNRVGKRIQAILNPTLARTPLGKIGIALLLGAAVGVITLTATISPFAKKKEVDEESFLAQFATSRDAPKNIQKVKILNPDGSAADRASIRVKTITIYKNPPSFPKERPSFSTASGDHSFGSDREGNFEIEVSAGTFVAFYAYSTAQSRTLVSQPILYSVSERDGDWGIMVYCLDKETLIPLSHEDGAMTLQLLEGIPVSGTAMFEDGTPAKGRTVSGIRPILPPDWVKNTNIANAVAGNFVLEFQAQVQADGTYELYLPPGDFQVREFNDRNGKRATSVSIAVPEDGEAKEEHRLDFLAVPAPLRGKFVKEDGSDPGRLEVYHMSKSNGSLSTCLESNGEFLFERHLGSTLIAMTEDNSLGAIHPIADDKLGEFQTVVLKPTATVRLLLQNSSGDPIAGQQVTVSTGAKTERSTLTTSILISPATTDSSGLATFHFPPGTGYYKFTWDEGEMEIEKTFQPGENPVIDWVVKGISRN